MSARVTSIHRYPVKSMRGEDLPDAVVEPWGLGGDRRWMLVDGAGEAITAREVNAMLLLRPHLTDDGVRVVAEGHDPLEVATPDPSRQVPVSVFGQGVTGAAADESAHAWFTDVLGVPARLVHLDDPRRRATDPRFSQDDDVVSFADGYPLLLANEQSLEALNDALLAADPTRDPLAMTRFRPNLVVGGAEAWAEDDWRRIAIGDAVFRAVKGCARCVMTTVDPETGERGKEPTATLARTRRWDGKTWFAVNLVPDSPGARVHVGDRVEVLESVPPGAGPLRASSLRVP